MKSNLTKFLVGALALLCASLAFADTTRRLRADEFIWSPGSTGALLFSGTAGILTQDSAALVWDDANNRLGIGTAAPSHPLNLVHSALSGTASYFNMTGTTATGNVMTMDQSGTSATGRVMLMRHFGLGRGLEILATNAANTNPMAVMTGTHGGYGLTVTTNAGAAQNYTATFSNLSTTATAVSGGVYGSTRTTATSSSAGVIGEVIGSGIGYGFFAVRNSAGQSLGLATNLGAGIGLSPSYAMSPANNYNLTLPLTQGAAGTGLINNGSGTLSWTSVLSAPNWQTDTTAASATCSKTCTAGVATGGGCTNTVAAALQKSYQSGGNTWNCEYDSAAGDCTAQVHCASN